MSVSIKSLTNGVPVKDTSLGEPNDAFNIIPTANEVYSLYTAAADKTAIAKGIRLVNAHNGPVTISLYFNKPSGTGHYRRRLLSPPDILLPAGAAYVDDGEVTLEPGDSIQAEADVANAIHYVISGVERDVV